MFLPRMLGYKYAQYTIRSHFGEVPSDFAMDKAVWCAGNETSLRDCPHIAVHDCGVDEGAGAVCSNSGWFLLSFILVS